MRASRFASAALLALAPLAFAISACSVSSTNTATSPDSNTLATLLVGKWTSSNSATSSYGTAESCGNFQWQVTNQDSQSASGTFSATCAGGITLNGTVSGTMTGNNQLNWTGSGTAHIPNQSDCPFSLSGVATLNGDTITMPYSGSTCMGGISGTETLTKK